jgi:hypothetical protein
MQFSQNSRAVGLLAALLAVALPAGASGAPLSHSAYRVVRVACARPRSAHGAACDALKLVPASSPSARSRARARHGGARALKSKGPAPGSLTPQQLHAAYELPAGTSVSAEQTIAVVDAYDDPTAEADLAVYDQQFDLPECTQANGCFRKIDEHGNESPLPETEGGWATEISIDVQMAHATCQNCHVLLVETNSEENADLSAGVNAAIAAGATEISNSYGSIASESELATEEREVNALAYDHPGTVITASSGDCGYHDQNNPGGYFSCEGLPSNVGFPAASPDVVAVGGTELTEGEGAWKSTVWENSGGGCSAIFSAPAWQTALGNWSATGCGSDRLSADVSAEADPYTGVAVYDSTPEFPRDRETGWLVYGGTSVASPIVAAEFALSGGARGVSYPAQTLYRHIGEGGALYDVTSGSNGSCAGASACQATVGYDGPSGVGSPLGLAAFAASASTPASTEPPGISGTAAVGQMLRATPGEWTHSPTVTIYQWEQCASDGGHCLPIQGATALTYTVLAANQGSTIRVMETASNSEGFGAPATSSATATVPAPPPAPTITKLSPKAGIAGTQVAISGSNFVNVTAVTFGSQAATKFKVDSEGEITAEAPEGSGTVIVTVTTQSGASEPKHKSRAKFRFKKPRR